MLIELPVLPAVALSSHRWACNQQYGMLGQSQGKQYPPPGHADRQLLTRGNARVRHGERLGEHGVCEPLHDQLQCLRAALERREEVRNSLLRSRVLLRPQVDPAGHDPVGCEGAEAQDLVVDIVQRRNDGAESMEQRYLFGTMEKPQ